MNAVGVARYLPAGIVATLVATVTLPARAEYCRTKTCDTFIAYDDVWQTEPDPPCTEDAYGCRLDGLPIYWPGSCLTYSVQEDGSPKQGIDYATMHGLVAEAFATWMNADCGGGARPSMRVDDLGAVTCNQLEYNSDQGNANIYVFRDDDWPHPPGSRGIDLALTTVTFNRENGQIFDADVELNSFQVNFTLTDDPDQAQSDLLSIVTHETGHFLGLSHDSSMDATMWSSYDYEAEHPESRFKKRDLYESDIRGVCEIYPPDLPVSKDACVPRHGYQRTCAVPQSAGCDCALASERANGARSLGLLAIVGLGLALRRRKG